MKTLIVVEQLEHWPLSVSPCELVTAEEYLTDPALSELRSAKVLNLCPSYRYQSTGYYVSLLAEARKHRPLPTLSTVQDIRNTSIARAVFDESDDLLQQALRNEQGQHVHVKSVFGRSLHGNHEVLTARLFRLFPAPFLRATFTRHPKTGAWTLASVSGFSITDVPPADHALVQERVNAFLLRPQVARVAKREASFELAILHNPSDPEPPSDERAMRRFERAAEDIGFAVEFIQKDDYERIAQYDALFIRETTQVHHHTYKFSRRAVAEGLVAVDDPISILRCTNKVFLAECMQRNRIPIPDTMLIHRGNLSEVGERLGFPCVLKVPDSSFSMGVFKIENDSDLDRAARAMFERSDLLVAQRFVTTEFDWRIGVFDRRPLYACKYFMARRHWQVIHRDGAGNKLSDGRSKNIPLVEVPPGVIETAVAAANLVGDGLYGVDLKEVNGRALVIEVNDNPSIDSGGEDAILGDELYRIIMRGLVERIERLRGVEKRT